LKPKEIHGMAAAALGARARFGRATAGSVGIHLLAALAIPALAWTSSTSLPVETISFSHIVHITITPPRVAAPAPRAIAPQHSIRPKITFANIRLVARSPHPRASHDPVVATNAPAAPAVGMVQRAGQANTGGSVTPNATASPAVRAVASVGEHQIGGYLPFGAEQPEPVLDPSVRKQLDALGVHVTLVIAVGDNGRTENIVFSPPLDPQVESRIRSLLADASWDPAVCGGGVSCEASATIKL
jgi:hypothetical protein